jgi:hypothetical protein
MGSQTLKVYGPKISTKPSKKGLKGLTQSTTKEVQVSCKQQCGRLLITLQESGHEAGLSIGCFLIGLAAKK